MPSRERSFRVDAIVLRHNDWGEADRLLVLFTREMGKLRVVAKGVRKLHSRKAGHLEPLTRVSLLLARGRDLLIVTQAETLAANSPLKEDLLLLGHASYEEFYPYFLLVALQNIVERMSTLTRQSTVRTS